MLTLTDVRRMVDNSAYYARGRAYVDEGRVVEIEEIDMGAQTILTGEVAGNGVDYEVDACFDEEELITCSCTCPAFARSGDMCKHVAALLIEYVEKNREQPAKARAKAGWTQPADTGAYSREQARLEAERMAERERTEKEMFLNGLLLAEDVRRRDGVRLRHEAAGDIRLFPTLVCEDGMAYMELKIGRARAYVVRSMEQFAVNSVSRSRVEFGKGLTFSHTEEELAPEDVELYRAVVDIARSEPCRGAQLPLRNNMLDRVMRLLLGRTVEMRAGSAPQQSAGVVEGAAAVNGALIPEGGKYRLVLTAPDAVMGDRGIYHFCAEAGEIRCAWGGRFTPVAPLMTIAGRYPQGLEMDNQRLADVAARLLVPAGAALEMTQGKDILLGLAPMPMRPQFYVDMQGRSRITCEVRYDYGAVNLGAAEENPHIRRDALLEEEAALCARRIFPKEDAPGRYAFEGGEEAVFDLLTQKLPELAKDGEVLVNERLRQINAASRRAMTFGMTREGGKLLLKADFGGLTQQDLEAAYLAYRQKKKYIVLADGTFLSGEGLSQAAQTAQLAKGLDLTAAELSQGASVPVNRAMYLEAALREREEMKLSAPGELKDFIARLNAAKDVEAEPPKGLRATLRPYQLTGYHWLKALCEAGFGGILADDMGLGKTLQALALLLDEKERSGALRALVICPASLQLNWLAEAKKFTPDLRCEVLSGTAEQRRAAITRADAPDVLIASYDQLRRDTQAYHGQHFTHMLLDEAQNIKNAASQGAKAVKTIDAEHRFAMTGTPIENRLSELWSIFDFLMPGYLLSYKKFRERFEAPIVQDDDEQTRDNLRLLVSPFILRRMKRDVLTDLPEKVETVLENEMTPEQLRMYKAHAARLAGELDAGEAKTRIEILAGLTRLRQICCDPALCLEGYAGGSGKLEQCVELVRNAVQADHEILLFSQFTTMLDTLRARLEGEGITTFVLKGDTPKEERMELVQRFNAGEADVFLISLKAGGTGLNLTGADVVIHYDPWWNTAAQNQATDRAYRIGQTQSVQVYKLITSGSIEERILNLQQEKAALSDAVLEGGEALGTLDEETMKRLLL